MSRLKPGVNEKTIKDFFSNPVWEYALDILKIRRLLTLDKIVEESKIDKIRILQGRIQELDFLIALEAAVMNDYLIDLDEERQSKNEGGNNGK